MRLCAVWLSCALAIASVYADTIRQIEPQPDEFMEPGALTDDGAFAFATSSDDPLGTNPDRKIQVFRMDTATGATTQLTFFEEGVEHELRPSVDDAGVWFGFRSRTDPLGTNADHSVELFIARTDGTETRQLTSASSPSLGHVSHFEIAGNASKAVFRSSVDYLGGSGDGRFFRNFVVDADGTNLIQLGTEADTDYHSATPSINDDGTRAVYSDPGVPGALYAINTDGTGKRRLPPLLFFAVTYTPRISGDGSRVTFSFQGNLAAGPPCAETTSQIGSIDWNGNGLVRIGCTQSNSQLPTIDDAGGWVVYDADGQVFRGETTGGTTTSISPCFASGQSGDGSTVVVLCVDDPYSGTNPDGGLELYAIDNAGANDVQLTTTVSTQVSSVEISNDGTKTAFTTNAPLAGGLADSWDVYLHDGATTTRVFDAPDGMGAWNASVQGDGARVWFVHNGNPLGSNAGGGHQLFRVDADGTNLTQVTPDGFGRVQVFELSNDGSKAAFVSNDDWGGLNPSLERSVWAINEDGSGLLKLAPGTAAISVSGDGNWVFYSDLADLSMRRIHPDGSGFEMLTTYEAFPQGASTTGHRVAFGSTANPTGGNLDQSSEVFWLDTATGAATQLSDCDSFAAPCSSDDVALSDDGEYVIALLRNGGFEYSAEPLFETMRFRLADGSKERVSGTTTCNPWDVSVNGDGSRVAMYGPGNCDGTNDDRQRGVFVTDPNGLPSPTPSPGAGATTVEWTALAHGLRYDAIRGDLASLAFDGVGGVNLGAVACIEDESIDTDTIGDEDAAVPLPGQAFFYLIRGTQGVDDGPGSYGAATDGSERATTAGDCPG